MDVIGFILNNITWTIGAIALSAFIAYGIWGPAQAKGPWGTVVTSSAPKAQNIALALIGFAIVGLDGAVADWFTTARAWLLDSIADGSTEALGVVGYWTVCLVAVFIWIDYIVPGGLEPGGQLWAHLCMWVISLLLWPLMAGAAGNYSLGAFAFLFIVLWIYNKKYRSGSKTSPPARTPTPVR